MVAMKATNLSTGGRRRNETVDKKLQILKHLSTSLEDLIFQISSGQWRFRKRRQRIELMKTIKNLLQQIAIAQVNSLFSSRRFSATSVVILSRS
jgi:hypothetical protein